MKTRKPITKIINSTTLPTPFLKRLLAWCKKRTGVEIMKEARFTKMSARGVRGRAFWSNRILIRIGANPPGFYPRSWSYPGRVNAPTVTFDDHGDRIVYVVLHECFHVRDFNRKITDVSENIMEHRTQGAFKDYLARKVELLGEWSVPVYVKPKAAPRPQSETTLERNRNSLARWESKLKMAKTKVAKYRRAVANGERYVERKQAAQKGGV